MPDFRIEEARLRPTPAMVAGYAQVPFVFAPGRRAGGPAKEAIGPRRKP